MVYTTGMAKTQVMKWGNSLAVRIPKAVAEKVRIREGDPILIEARKGCVEIRSVERIPTFEELVAQITPENRYDETDWGADAGKEIVEW
jgi:antitoxin MazE